MTAKATTRRKLTMPTGVGVDPSGGPLIDPTQNVLDLVGAANLRQDDLRAAAKELSDTKIAHQQEIGELREKHQEALRTAESQRLDSIRQVDREDVNKTAAQALNAIATLATATTTTAETLRTQVATTASAAATSLANSMGEVNKRLSALELASSEGRGKQTVADPMLEEMRRDQKSLIAAITSSAGQSQGKEKLWGYILGAAGLLVIIWRLMGKM